MASTGVEENMSALVLIAASDPKRLERLRGLVEGEGAAALTALDAREAMRLFVRRAPDLTLLHLDSEDELRMELCRDMKTLRVGRNRPVFVVGARETRPEAFKSGCDAFVSRQSDSRPLKRAVRRFLDGARRSRPGDTVESIV